MYSPGMTAMAAPVRRPGLPVTGVITIAGPLMRLNEKRMLELGAELLAVAGELATASSVSPLFNQCRPASPTSSERGEQRVNGRPAALRELQR